MGAYPPSPTLQGAARALAALEAQPTGMRERLVRRFVDEWLGVAGRTDRDDYVEIRGPGRAIQRGVGGVSMLIPSSGKRGRSPLIELRSPPENGYSESSYGKLRDELLDRELFYTLREAQGLIEWGRPHDNTVRRHRALGYRPPAPAARAFPTRPRSRSRC